MSLYVPPFRVSLERWCQWSGASWDKIAQVVGRSFRQAGRHESIYTMAANAVLRLINDYEIDPTRVGFLGFGTESSTDNAAGAVIIRGMVDQALSAQGRPRLARDCEVPELKHACLGGIYALKAAARYLRADGAGRQAIVVAGDIAEYERGSSGEQTQGAGCVAMLVEEDPALCTLELEQGGSSSSYRGLDFRKPFARHRVPGYTPRVQRLHDFPVFNGKYSTYCYLDAVTHAVREMAQRQGCSPNEALRRSAAMFFHRPYHWMPVQALATLYVRGLAVDGRDELAALCDAAGLELAAVLDELQQDLDLFHHAHTVGVSAEPHPLTSHLVKGVRSSPRFEALRREKLELGSERMMELGNLYTAALPAWLAAGFFEAQARDVELAGETLLAIGYGSGDAAEAIPMRVQPRWRDAAARIGFDAALAGAVDLEREQYEALHDGHEVPGISYEPRGEFVIERTGRELGPELHDVGIEYYAWVPAA